MKKIVFLFLMNYLFVNCFTQVPVPILTNKVNKKDTTQKSNTNTVPAPVMTEANTSGNNQPVPEPAGTPVVPKNPPADKPPVTLEELAKKVADLESQVNELNKRIPFQNMVFADIVANNSNISGSTRNILKIDNPACNNNPKAKFLFLTGNIVGAYYQEPYWYATLPFLRVTGFESVYLTPFKVAAFNSNMFKDDDVFVLKQMDPKKGIANVFLTGNLNRINEGEKFSFIIFTELPAYNPARSQKAQEQ